jgi:hypothetical protein
MEVPRAKPVGLHNVVLKTIDTKRRKDKKSIPVGSSLA